MMNSPAAPGELPQKELRILILEDMVSDAELIGHELRRSNMIFSALRLETEDEFIQALAEFHPDLILADSALPSFDGMSALSIAQERLPDVPFIFVSGTLGEEVAIETLKSGATDYVLKQRLSRLGPSVKRALREAQERVERKRAEAELALSLEQLRALATHLQSVREEERKLMAREIHDELGQALTGLKYDLAWLEKRLAEDFASLPACLEKLHDMSQLLTTTIQIGRKIATQLRPGILDDLGLIAAMEWQLQEFMARTNIQYKFTAFPKTLHLDADRSTTVFRIFQETLTNVARHAQATLINVELQVQTAMLRLDVRDNGRGINPQEINGSGSLGLVGMRERVLPFGGEISISGQAGRGTTVTVRLPLENLPIPEVNS